MARFLFLCVAVCAFTGVLQSQPIDVLSYQATLRFDFEATHISATARVTLRNVMPGDLSSVELDLRQLRASALRRVGAAIPFRVTDTTIIAELPSPLRSLDTLTLEIDYGGTPSDSAEPGSCVMMDSLAEAHPQANYLPFMATLPYWLPCHNVLRDKASYDLTFIVPPGMRAAAAGTLISESHSDSASTFRWVFSSPASVQSIGWAVARYSVIDTTWNGLPLVYYVFPGDSARAREYFADVPRMLDTLSARFGPYPGEKIGFCATQYHSVEGLDMIHLDREEMQGRADETAMHELAHQWFGNSLTPASIDEYWLSEGFAQFGGWLHRNVSTSSERLNNTCTSMMPYYMNGLAQSEGIFPLYGYRNFTEQNFCGTIYFKGAIVLNMLRNVMGSDTFFAAMRDYAGRYRHTAVTTEQFRSVMETHYGDTLGWFFREWVYDRGWPILEFRRVRTPGMDAVIEIRQLQSARGWPLFEMPFDLEILIKPFGSVIRRLRMNAVEIQTITVQGVPDSAVRSFRFDPRGWIMKQATDVTALDAAPDFPASIAIRSISPHPVISGRPASVFVDLPRDSRVRAELRDVLGRTVLLVPETSFPAGPCQLHVTIPPLPTGLYNMSVFADGVPSTLFFIMRK